MIDVSSFWWHPTSLLSIPSSCREQPWLLGAAIDVFAKICFVYLANASPKSNRTPLCTSPQPVGGFWGIGASSGAEVGAAGSPWPCCCGSRVHWAVQIWSVLTTSQGGSVATSKQHCLAVSPLQHPNYNQSAPPAHLQRSSPCEGEASRAGRASV